MAARGGDCSRRVRLSGQGLCSLDGVVKTPRTLLLAAGICAGMFLLLLVLAYASSRARTLDANAVQGFVEIPEGRGATLTERISALGDPLPVALAGIALASVALIRGRPRVALAVVLLVGATSISSQLLKAALAYPRAVGEAVVGPEAFPSGHSTAAMTLALCGVLVAPARLRPLAAAVGMGFALAMAFASLSLGWHFPSDVVGGYLLAAGWTFVLMAALLAGERRRPERPGRFAIAARSVVDRLAAVGLLAALLAGAAALVLASIAVLSNRSDDVSDFARDHTAAVVVAPAIVSAAALLVAAITALLRRED
jgi:membrane-associated phospholipid phosphatase